ncbi:uncharacterized protein [Physcomitrium patens]|uniref:Uncharacterized protein n=1 Tax=Physcomitrium patens TaxID=3218 RepID=A9TNZ3_PHYPA|nr:uncharacterized protein LOC112278349 [Physcomitrium patens]XP_024367458.1 uncharacterized protein LOC112278349 [Physcomitrium patens]XP_024367459.1 uncharacterized protein LOC112278349 [Physcomitrium patens]PNR26376.1 hypothetical protein PHYPA_030951 [Physcomitrium patens]|eukprot:XP_024367457.1 uncharacterized protein LOC112278349 [Physcomitrella patens]
MSWLWEKSGTWRWVVMNSKYNKGFFFAFTTLCFMGSWALGEAVMRTTNMSQISLDEELRRRARPDSMMVGQVNKDRLRQLLEEVQRKENTEDRYAAALRGETLTGTPGARVRGGAGTSMQSPSSQPEKIAVSLQTGQTVKDTKVPATTTS